MSSPVSNLFLLHGATLALAWYFVLNVLGSVAVSSVARRVIERSEAPPPGLWFGLRVLPAAAALAFVVAMFVPSYWKYEPREAAEALDLTLIACAAGGLVMLAAGIWRGASAWYGAARRTRAWMSNAAPLALPGTRIPAFEVDAPTAVMALAGVFRPRLLVTRALIEALTPDELAASVAHEIGHSHARDNLKRLIMRSAPDAFGATASARALEQRWAATSEHCADSVAGRRPAARCALASALVKVARLTIDAPPIGEPISTLVGGGDIASRVRRLLDDVPLGATSRRVEPTVAAAAFLVAALAYAPLLQVVHRATEALVYFLP